MTANNAKGNYNDNDNGRRQWLDDGDYDGKYYDDDNDDDDDSNGNDDGSCNNISKLWQ